MAERFLRIVARQTDRLNVIIEDLLSLSKIEKEAESGDMVLEPASVRLVLESALHNCEIQAAERNIRVVLDCNGDLQAKMKPDLLEQAITNLLDNAIKYSEPGREVQVRGERTPGERVLMISISSVDRPALPPWMFIRLHGERGRPIRSIASACFSMINTLVARTFSLSLLSTTN